MAEAVVEERSTVPTRFYCHMCKVEINIPNTDYTCPLCSGGFVEELPATHPPATTTAASSSGSSSSVNVSDGNEASNYNRLSQLDGFPRELATLIMARNGPVPLDPAGSRRGNFVRIAGDAGGGSSGTTSISVGGPSGGGNLGGGRVRSQNMDRLENVLFDFLQSLSSGDVETPFGNSQMLYMGNLGDYAWGREGIDTIVTQLLNQMETSGPPPLAKEKIDEIPKVEITADEVERKQQCSVCWEDFKLEEVVRKLPCSHIYHENCIVPWLDLHGTCPICRKSLIDNEGEDETMEFDESGDGGGGVREAATPRSATAASTGTTTSTGTGTSGGGAAAGSSGGGSSQNQQNQRNNVFSFDDSNVDLD